MIDDLAAPRIHSGNDLHILLIQFKIPDVHVFPDAFGMDGFGDHHHAALDMPAEDDLRYAFPMLRANGGENFVLKIFFCPSASGPHASI